MPISKTDFIRGLQCKKMLWLDAHKKELRVVPPEVQKRLDEGNEFGDTAMGIFGEFVETTAYREDGRLYYAQMIETTKRLLEARAPVICEAAFSWLGNYCAADILKWEKGGYALYEVKNSAQVKKEFVLDLAFQRFLMKQCHLTPVACRLILPADETEEDKGQGSVEVIKRGDFVYKIIDVSAAVAVAERTVQNQLFPLGKIKTKAAECPSVAMGEQCHAPYPCWYLEYCENAKKDE